MASVFQDAVSEVLVQQSWWQRRKDSIAATTGTALQVANLGVLLGDQFPAWVNLLAAVLIGVAQVITHAATKGAVTPSMAARLEEAADIAHLDRESVSGVALTGTTAPEPVEAELEYVGAHRADEETDDDTEPRPEN